MLLHAEPRPPQSIVSKIIGVEVDKPHQFIPRASDHVAQLAKDSPYLIPTLAVQEHDHILTQVNDRPSRCAFDFVGNYQFPIPQAIAEMRPASLDHECTERVFIRKHLAEWRRIIAMIVDEGMLVTRLEKSIKHHSFPMPLEKGLKPTRHHTKSLSAPSTDLEPAPDVTQQQRQSEASTPTIDQHFDPPPADVELGIPLNVIGSVVAERDPPRDDNIGDSETINLETEARRSIFFSPLCGLVIFLAPVIIVSGMTASHGDNWKFAFVGLFILWLLAGSAWLVLDLRKLTKLLFTKRCLCHLSGCAASLYFFMSILHVTSDNLPQWLPTIIDCGIGASVGTQSVPPSTRQRVRDYFTSVIGSISGVTQVIAGRDQEQLLRRSEDLTARRRPHDTEIF